MVNPQMDEDEMLRPSDWTLTDQALTLNEVSYVGDPVSWRH